MCVPRENCSLLLVLCWISNFQALCLSPREVRGQACKAKFVKFDAHLYVSFVVIWDIPGYYGCHGWSGYYLPLLYGVLLVMKSTYVFTANEWRRFRVISFKKRLRCQKYIQIFVIRIFYYYYLCRTLAILAANSSTLSSSLSSSLSCIWNMFTDFLLRQSLTACTRSLILVSRERSQWGVCKYRLKGLQSVGVCKYSLIFLHAHREKNLGTDQYIFTISP